MGEVMLSLSLLCLLLLGSPASLDPGSGSPSVPSSPRDLSVSLVTATTARLDWLPPSEPNGNLTVYTVVSYQTRNSRSALSLSVVCV